MYGGVSARIGPCRPRSALISTWRNLLAYFPRRIVNVLSKRKRQVFIERISCCSFSGAS